MTRIRSWLPAVWLVASAIELSACAFPIIEFEEQGPAQRLAYVGTQHSQPRAAGGRMVIAQQRREGIVDERPKSRRPSVIAPLDPAPEPQPRIESRRACERALAAEGVRFEILPRAAAPGVTWPIRLRSRIHGVAFDTLDHDETHEILDCRLGLALAAWARDLRRAGVLRVEHYSMYRPGARVGGDGAISGHAHGMAIDAARFTLDSGITVNVLDDWDGRSRGEAPCPVRREEPSASRLLRRVTCAAIDDQVFQVVLTPHYNKAHENHVHLEQKPDADWTYVR